MAYIINISKQDVQRLNSLDYQVAIHVVVTDGATSEIILEKDYSERYNSSTPVSTIQAKLQDQIKADWDKLKAEKVIFDAAAFNTVVAEIQTAATAYINS